MNAWLICLLLTPDIPGTSAGNIDMYSYSVLSYIRNVAYCYHEEADELTINRSETSAIEIKYAWMSLILGPLLETILQTPLSGWSHSDHAYILSGPVQIKPSFWVVLFRSCTLFLSGPAQITPFSLVGSVQIITTIWEVLSRSYLLKGWFWS